MASEKFKVTWAQALRDVLLESMSNGQMIPVTLFLILLISVLKMSGEQLERATTAVYAHALQLEGVSYVLWIVTIAVWGVVMRRRGQLYETEIARLANERDRLQELLAGKPFKSSKVR